MTCHLSIAVTDQSSIGEARRAAVGVAASVKMDSTDSGRTSIVATELATNLVRHTKPNGGTMLIWGKSDGGRAAVEMTAIDTGPGMNDIAKCFEDGYSTAGTAGNGLGAIWRLSDGHDLFSAPSGTVLWCQVTAGGASASARPPTIGLPRSGALSTPAPGETECGDNWRFARAEDGRMSLMIADGLGHGPLAAEASAGACKLFDAEPFAAPSVMIEKMHVAISGTRGAAISVASIDPAISKLTYVGVGNIAGTLISPDGASRGLFSHNGTVGHLVRKIQTFEYPWSTASLLLLHSDGLQTRWVLDKYPGLSRRHPAVIAGVLYRDFRRGRDDSTVVVVGPPEFHG